MKIEKRTIHGINLALVTADKCVIMDTQSALDLAMTAYYEADASKIVIEKGLIREDFFILSTGIAGEILQKYINYHVKMAIYGDYTRYTSKPLKDFIYESNQGNDFFFVSSKEEAIQKLLEAK